MAVGKTEIVIIRAGMATMGMATKAMTVVEAMGITAAAAMGTTPATAIITIVATTLASMATSASMAINSSMGMIAGITNTTKAVTTPTAVIDLGLHPEA